MGKNIKRDTIKNPEEILHGAEVLLKQGKTVDAERMYQHYLKCYVPEHRNLVYLNLANLALEQHNIPLAIDYLKLSLESIPIWQARFKLGEIYTNKTAQYKLALEQYDILIEEKTHPVSYMPYALAGNVWMLLNKPEKALSYFLMAVYSSPKNAFLLDRLAFIYFILGRFSKAEEAQKKAISIDESGSFLFNLAEIYRKQKKLDDCLATFKKAIALNPNDVNFRVNHSHALLHAGRYDIAWKEAEWRRLKKGFFRPFTQPHWDGYEVEDIENKTLLLYGEQGFGDTLQFIRFIPMLRERFPWKQVILEVNPPLKPLLVKRSHKHPSLDVSLGDVIDEVYGYNEAPLDSFSYHCSVMTLPYILNINSFDKIPVCPYLDVSKDKVDKWKEQLTKDTKFKVGLCWHGLNPTGDKKLEEIGARRNIPLKLWEPILNVENVSFYSFQKGDASFEISTVMHNIIDYTEELTNWEDTAALILNMDLVICVDTAICHLAGALNIPTWVLSRNDECWRWLLEKDVGDTSPWYSSIRLFRQSDWVAWTKEIEEVADSLAEMTSSIVRI